MRPTRGWAKRGSRPRSAPSPFRCSLPLRHFLVRPAAPPRTRRALEATPGAHAPPSPQKTRRARRTRAHARSPPTPRAARKGPAAARWAVDSSSPTCGRSPRRMARPRRADGHERPAPHRGRHAHAPPRHRPRRRPARASGQKKCAHAEPPKWLLSSLLSRSRLASATRDARRRATIAIEWPPRSAAGTAAPSPAHARVCVLATRPRRPPAAPSHHLPLSRAARHPSLPNCDPAAGGTLATCAQGGAGVPRGGSSSQTARRDGGRARRGGQEWAKHAVLLLLRQRIALCGSARGHRPQGGDGGTDGGARAGGAAGRRSEEGGGGGGRPAGVP